LKLSLSWLRELVAIEMPVEKLAERLTLAGLAVDAVEPVGRYDGIVAATITNIEPHRAADRLNVCTVDAGRQGRFTIVSGAPGLAAGWRVVLAKPGAKLADGSTVEGVEIRGERSEAVLVSERELGISEAHATVMRLAIQAEPGTPISEALGTEDTVLEIDVTPNRGDCLSVLGVAREIAALTGERLLRPARRVPERGAASAEAIAVEIQDPRLCSRYVGRVIRGVTVGPSPLWMRARLEAAGLRSINNVVDVTNYVLLERGQPMHAFDLSRIEQAKIVVRRAGDTRRLRTLDEVERTLESDDLVIADAVRPVALAGVIGGAESAVTGATSDVLLESARFDPATIRRTSRRLGLQTDASYRFERGVDVEGSGTAAERAADLLAKVANGTIGVGAVDAYPAPPAPIDVTVRGERVNRLLGTSLSISDIGQALRRISSNVRAAGRGGFVCRVPTYRADLEREADFIEEVARLAGYDAVPETLPHVPLAPNPVVQLGWIERTIRERLIAQGLFEMVNLRFLPAEWNRRVRGILPADASPIRMANALSSETEELATSALPQLLLALQRNRHQGERSVRAFELSRAFWRTPAGATGESKRLAGLLWGRAPVAGFGRQERSEDFADLKGVLESLFGGLGVADVGWSREGLPAHLHPGKAVRLTVAADDLGWAGGLHPEVAQAADLEGEVWVFELDSEKLGHYASRRFRFRPLPRFPAVARSLAIVTDESFESAAIVNAVAERPDLKIEEIRLFDVYRGQPVPAGKKSLAYDIRYRDAERTLTDAEVNALHQGLTELLIRRFGVDPRT
jgi:phenylalanyl-tRNA synthetase beta chain